MTAPLSSTREKIAQINSDLRWVTERLHDSQEHAQIVILEERRERLWKQLAALQQESP